MLEGIKTAKEWSKVLGELVYQIALKSTENVIELYKNL